MDFTCPVKQICGGRRWHPTERHETVFTAPGPGRPDRGHGPKQADRFPQTPRHEPEKGRRPRLTAHFQDYEFNAFILTYVLEFRDEIKETGEIKERIFIALP
jgi:hypothetical protein